MKEDKTSRLSLEMNQKVHSRLKAYCAEMRKSIKEVISEAVHELLKKAKR